MVLDLHIWGPAFGLPSIDAQCLAAVAYCHQCLPRTEWRLIPSSATSTGASGDLPALHFDSTWVFGFHAIVQFLRDHSTGRWDLDRDLKALEKADCVAFSAFLESRGQPLLDLALFVSSDNYTEWTRPALSRMLTWPQQWLVPHKLRETARKRSEHLGLSSMDVEGMSEHEEGDSGPTRTKGTSKVPKSLMSKPKETLSNILGRAGGQNQIRLDAVTSDFFEPLCQLIQEHGEQSWVFGTEHATSLDCLLVGYLSMASPILTPPHRWLQDALAKRYPALSRWATCFRQECFVGTVNPTDVLSVHSSDQSALPWHPPALKTVVDIGWSMLTIFGDSLPFVTVPRPGRRDSVPEMDLATVQPPVYLALTGTLMGLVVGSFLFGVRGSPNQTDHLFGRRRVTGLARY